MILWGARGWTLDVLSGRPACKEKTKTDKIMHKGNDIYGKKKKKGTQSENQNSNPSKENLKLQEKQGFKLQVNRKSRMSEIIWNKSKRGEQLVNSSI